jgi:fluoroquinolone transport system permease protein
MNKLLLLIKGELTRLTKYHVTTVSMLVAVVWFLLLYFLDDQDLLMEMLPFVIIIDATMMSVIFIGSVMFFEKTESTFSTMLVTPVTNAELILSKAIANTLHSMFSSTLVILAFFIVKQVDVVWYIIIPGLALSIFMHSLLGFVFSFHSKDFTTLLVNVMIYSFVITIPVVLHYFDLILKADIWDTLLLIVPTQAAIELIVAGFGTALDYKFVVSIVVLLLYAILGYYLYVKPKFKEYAVKQSGV